MVGEGASQPTHMERPTGILGKVPCKAMGRYLYCLQLQESNHGCSIGIEGFNPGMETGGFGFTPDGRL
jgi:hypothetical protein